MKIEHCQFPDDLLYDGDGFVWLRKEGGNLARIGITSIYSSLAGKLTSVRFKDITEIEKGRAICSIESPRYFGLVKVPISGKVVEVNFALAEQPWLANDSPYEGGWLALLQISQLPVDEKELADVKSSQEKLHSRIKELRIKCFAVFPDHQMFEIGVECATVLVKLNELLTKIPTGDIIHVVSDDATAPVEMVRWSYQTGHTLVEMREDENLYHAIVRKAK